MTKRYLIEITWAAGFLILPFAAGAQQHAPAVSMPMMAPARPMAVMTPSAAGHIAPRPVPVQAAHSLGHSTAPTSHLVSARNSTRPVYPKTPVHSHPNPAYPGAPNTNRNNPAIAVDDGYATPGLGFDYSHYAAVHPGQRHHHFYGGAIYPFIGGGYYLPTGGYVDTGVPQEAANEAQPDEAADAVQEAPEVAPVEQAPIYSRLRPQPTETPVASPEYIFVRRDGTVFFAVAYSWTNGNLQYVTHDGLRKLASGSTLDMDATTQFNEQRGLTVRSPA